MFQLGYSLQSFPTSYIGPSLKSPKTSSGFFKPLADNIASRRCRLSKRILVIDDDDLVRKSVARLLKREGFECELACDAEEAIAKANKQSFDLVISDIRMPGKNGVEAIREIRKIFDKKIKKDVPIIFITGYASSGLELNAVEHGEIISKPFDVERLVMTIREYL